MARRSNYNIDLRKRRIYKTKSLPKPQSGSKLKTYRLSAMITSFAVQFSIEDKDNFAVYDKDYRNVWTPRKQSAELSSDNPAKISHNKT